MHKNNRSKSYNKNSSSMYSNDSLDHYNEDLSKRAVGAIFNNIERGTDDNQDYTEEIVVDTNYNIKDDREKKRLVGQFFNDDESTHEKRRPKQARPQPVREKKSNQPLPRHQNAENSALVKDDDTIATKFVTRGNHPITTPAMAARRKKVTMMESQRIPVISEEEITEYKKNNSKRGVAYVNARNKETVPVDYDDYINRKDVTFEQKELVEYFAKEADQKEQNFENTLHRISEKNKHLADIINTSNTHKAPTNDFEEDVDFDESEQLNNNFDNSGSLYENSNEEYDHNNNLIVFDEALNQEEDFEFSEEDFEKDFEDTLYANGKSKSSKPFIPTNNLQENKAKKHKPNFTSKDDEEYYDLATDTYVSKKAKYTTAEVKKINDTIATEVPIDQLEDFLTNHFDARDMEYLRETIKAKTTAKKMQNIDNKMNDFQRENVYFNSKAKEQPKQQSKQKEEANYNSYDYRKTRKKIEKPSTYANDSFNTNSDTQNIKTNGSDNYYKTSENSPIHTKHTSKIQALNMDIEQEVDEYYTKFNISLMANIILGVSFVIAITFMFMKTSDLNSQLQTATITNTELLSQNNRIAEIEMELDYYKGLYAATEEGQKHLQQEDVDSAEPADKDDVETTKEITYTVVSGDTLSSISKKFYGNSSQYQKIKDANNLTSDSLNLGQVLVIPN